jgi:hypothetical protein
MRILFDHGTPSGIARRLGGHIVTEARELGWDKISNGDLLNSAEAAGFEMLLTTGKYPVSAEPDRSQDFHSGAWQLAMAGCAVAPGSHRRHRGCRRAWQLCRGGYPFQVRGCWPRGLSGDRQPAHCPSSGRRRRQVSMQLQRGRVQPAPQASYFSDALIFARYSTAFCRICGWLSVRMTESRTTGLPFTITSRTSSAFKA